MFQLLDYSTIIASMVSEALAVNQKVTDMTEGGVFRSLLEAPAVELQRQNFLTYQGVREGIEVGTYKNFSFNRLPAVFAVAVVVFSHPVQTEAITIPVGTRVKVPGTNDRVYTVMDNAALPLDTPSVEALVRCETAGAAGNTPANTIVSLVDSVPGVSVTNLTAVLTGVDQETPEDRRNRFRLFIAGLSRATKVAIEGATLGVFITDAENRPIERVTGAHVREPYLDDPPDGRLGLVEVYVDNGAGSASPTLVQAVRDVLIGTEGEQGIIPGWVAAGISLDVFPVTGLVVNVSCIISVSIGYDPAAVKAEVESALLSYLHGLSVFAPVINAELISTIMNVDGVVDARIPGSRANIATGFNQRVIPGVITVTVGAVVAV